MCVIWNKETWELRRHVEEPTEYVISSAYLVPAEGVLVLFVQQALNFMMICNVNK
jgi:hypothetical protein